MRFKGKKIVAFDFDGTIVDSMEAFADVAARVMNHTYGTPPATARRQYIETSGLPFFQQLEIIHQRDPKNGEASKQFEEEKLIGYFEQEIYPDAIATTEELRRRGILSAVSSNNFQNLVDKFVKISGLKLDFVMGFKEDNFCKGAPHFQYLIDKTGFSKNELLFVGDSLKDAERASDFEIDFIGKTGLFRKEDFEVAIDKLDELLKLI